MSKKTYLIFHPDGVVEKVKSIDSDLYQLAEDGNVTIVDPKLLKYLDSELDWEDIPLQEKEDVEEDYEELEEDEAEDEFI
jgi:hypothetical protein